jgi:MFS family permease
MFEGMDRRMWILFYGRIIAATGFSIVIPFISIYFVSQYGISMTEVGVILLISSSIGAIGQIVGGEVADRIGRRTVMALAMSARAFIFLLAGIAVFFSSSYLVIAGLVTIASFWGSMFEPATNAYIADIVPPNKRLEAYGMLRVGQNAGWALGPLIGGLLAFMGFGFLFFVGGMAMAIMAMVVIFMMTETLKVHEHQHFSFREMGSVLKDTPFLVFCLVSIFLFIMFGQMSSTYAVWSTGHVGVSEAEVGYLYAINGVIVILIQMPIARWIAHYRMSSVIAMGAFCYFLGYALVGWAGGFAMLAICMVVITMGEVVVSPSSMNLVAALSPENKRGRYMGVYGLFSSFGVACGPICGGLIMDGTAGIGPLTWFLIATFGLMATFGYLIMGRMVRSLDDAAAGGYRS